ncbi:MAG: efflux RND transporter periplasmic adaptor subunit [Acidobacteriaceae bacterium]
MQARASKCKTGRASAFLSAAGLLAPLLAGCGGADKTPPTVVSVQAVAAQQTSIPLTVHGEALLSALYQAVISPKISAPIARLYVQRGDKVHKGELLAVLDNKDLAGAALSSQGQYQQAKAQYQTITKATVPQEVKKAQADLRQARAVVDLQQQIYTSRKKLFTEGALPGRDVDQAKVALVQAKVSYDVAQRHLTALEEVNRAAELETAAGQLHQAEGQFNESAATLAYSEIRSPIDGYVTQRPLYQGEMASAGSPLLTVMDTSILVAKAHLPQSQVQGLPVGAPALVSVPGIADPVHGTVMLVSPALDPGSTTVEVWVKVKNKNNELKAGTPVQVAITARTVPNALIVPTMAIVENAGGGKHVMVVGADNIAHRREVKVGVQSGDDTQILSGIQAGEQVIAVGAYALDDGTHVRIVQPASEDKPSAGSAD